MECAIQRTCCHRQLSANDLMAFRDFKVRSDKVARALLEGGKGRESEEGRERRSERGRGVKRKRGREVKRERGRGVKRERGSERRVSQ